MWQKCLGGNNGDYSYSIEPTPDGGFIIAGNTEGQDNGDVVGYHGNPMVGDIWIVKTDNAGNIQWQKCLGGAYFETGAFIHPTPDGGYIFAGTSSSVDCNITGNLGGSDYWVVKMNSTGEVLWQKHYGGSKNEYAWSFAPAPDGGYFVSGETESADGDITLNHGIRDYWVIRIDGAGNLLWQKSLGGSGDDEAFSVQATADGGCITAGFTESNDGDVTGNHGKRDYWVVKLNNTGGIQWQKALGGSESEFAWSVQLTDDGGYIVAGSAASNNDDVSGNHQSSGGAFLDFWVVKLNSAGSLLWQKCYGGNGNEIAYAIQPSHDGGFLVCGSAESADGDLHCNAGITDMWVIKINSTGILQWEKNIGGNYYEEAHDIKELPDGTLIVTGNTCSENVSGYHKTTGGGSCGDIWLVKLSTPLSTVPAPVITINPASANICSGVPATLTTSVLYGGINPVYQWTKNGVNVGTNSSTYSDAGLAGNDQITCSIISGGGCETTSQPAS
ncbi:MAG TPA: immunoglobulin domain-containing protein, partial [Puia sp.]|nr:immunoglobulin domain-containing protein [Puia sp.]